MPGAMSNSQYYDDDDLPEGMRDIIKQYEYEKKKIAPPSIVMPKRQLEEDIAKKTMEEYERQIKKLTGTQTNISEAEQVRRKIQPQLDEIKEGMRKIGIMFDTDLPDEEAFKKFKMLREAYRKYKLIEKLVLGEDDD